MSNSFKVIQKHLMPSTTLVEDKPQACHANKTLPLTGLSVMVKYHCNYN